MGKIIKKVVEQKKKPTISLVNCIEIHHRSSTEDDDMLLLFVKIFSGQLSPSWTESFMGSVLLVLVLAYKLCRLLFPVDT